VQGDSSGDADPLASLEAVRLADDLVVSRTASADITGRDTSSIPTTSRTVKPGPSVPRGDEMRHQYLALAGCGGFDAAGELGELTGGRSDLLGRRATWRLASLSWPWSPPPARWRPLLLGGEPHLARGVGDHFQQGEPLLHLPGAFSPWP